MNASTPQRTARLTKRRALTGNHLLTRQVSALAAWLGAFMSTAAVAHAGMPFGTPPAETATTPDAPAVAPVAATPAAPPVLVLRARPRTPKPPPPPSTAPANATLRVNAAALGTPWTFELTNSDSTPLRIVTDGRLLTLDVLPAEPADADGDDDGDSSEKHPDARSAAKATHKRASAKRAREVHCELPSEVRPTTDGDNARVLPPGVSYVETFDPRLYCFDEREAAALAPGTRVVAHLGWPAPRTGTGVPPFIADESFGGEERSGVKEITAEAVLTPEPLAPSTPDAAPTRVIDTAPARVDAETGGHLLIDVTVKNPSSRPMRLMLRPETLAFEVSSPRGIYQCAWRTHPGAPIAEVFNQIPPHGEVSANVLLSSVCPDAAFQSAGLYSVRARLDTRKASGKAIGIDTFDGRVEALAPTLVRIRRDHARRP